MNTDLPLSNSKDDKLNRFAFASEIASGLVNSFQDNNESIVLGINGSWGSGKSTLINFIINEVDRLTTENNSTIIILRFNPWMFSGQKELQNIFLKELFLKLESNKAKFKDASQKIAEFMGHLRWLKYFHQGFGDAIKDAEELLKGFNNQKDLAQLKQELDDLLIQSKVKLYITIDDIDRLTPSEISDIFQLVKLNGNFANTVFILAYDQKIVTSALQRQFGENGKKYIEKIVQVDYTLPSISKQALTSIFIDSLCKLFPSGELQTQIIALSDELINKPFNKYFTSLRDVYRFNNAIKLRLPSIYNEINIVDFILVESLRIFNINAYEFIIEHRNDLISKNVRGFYDSRESQDEKNVVAFISSTDFDSITQEVLKFLFTGNSNGYRNTFSIENSFVSKSVASGNYFDRYFSLQLTASDIQERFFENFIKNISIDDNVAILNKFSSEDKILTFLHWTNLKSQFATKEQIENMFSSSLKFIASIKYEGEFYSSGDTTFVTVIRFCTDLLKKISDIKVKHDLILNNINKNSTEFTFSSLYIANRILEAKNKFDKNQLSYEDKWHQLFSDDIIVNTTFTINILDIILDSSKQLFIKELNDKNFLSDMELSLVLKIASKYHYDFYISRLPDLINSDNNLIRLIRLSMRVMGSSEGNGYELSKDRLFLGMDVNHIKNRIEIMNLENLNEDENIIVKIFLKAYADGFKKNRSYNFKTLKEMDWE